MSVLNKQGGTDAPVFRGAPVIKKASALVEDRRRRQTDPTFSFSNLAGRITEFSASRNAPVLSFLSVFICEVQELGEPTVWVSACDSFFYPPDFEDNGVDLAALPVVWNPDVQTAVRSVEHLLRSNAFGLIVVDLPPHAIIDQGRLGKLARMADLNRIAVVLITQHDDKTPFTLGSIISLRVLGRRNQSGAYSYTCTLSAIKDKQDPTGWQYSEGFYVPDGLC